MKRLISAFVAVILAAAFMLTGAVKAADLSVYVVCGVYANEVLTVQFGYTSTDTLSDGGAMYIADSIDIATTEVQLGTDRAAAAILQPGDRVMLALDGLTSDGEYLYAETWVTYGDSVPDCSTVQAGTAPRVTDDEGGVNNPAVNDRANTCYNPGQVCLSEADWIAGWYRIRSG